MERTPQRFEVEVPQRWHRQRADKALAALIADTSRSQLQKCFGAGRVWRDDAALAQKTPVRAGDVLTVEVAPPVPLELRPVAMPLKILYEDADLLALDKASGQVIHPGAGTGEDTLVHGLLHHCGDSLKGIGGVERPGIVHRLDKETSGVLVVAKTEAAFQGLAQAFAERSLAKYYTALVVGQPAEAHRHIDAPIGRHPTHRTRMCVSERGRSAQTEWWVQQRWATGGIGCALLRVRIHTGRTHQIRVHAAHCGHALCGDSLYGFRARPGLPDFPRVMLHAARLELEHPVLGTPLVLEAPLPDDVLGALRDLGEPLGGHAPA